MMKNFLICISIIMLSVCVNAVEISYDKTLKQLKGTSAETELNDFRACLLKYEPMYMDCLEKESARMRKSFRRSRVLKWSQLHSFDINVGDMDTLLQEILTIKFKSSHLKKLDDPVLFDLIMKLYGSEHECLRYCGMKYFGYFSNTLIDKNIDKILAVFEKEKISNEEIIDIPLSDYSKKRYEVLFNKIILETKKEISSQTEKSNFLDYADKLYLCAYLGDEEAKKKMIETFQKMQYADEDNNQIYFCIMIGYLLDLNTRDTVIAVLSRFRENTGAPDFYVGASPRYDILCALYRKYADNDFFKQYSHYLCARSVFSPLPEFLDEYIGGEEGVTKLFNAFQDWAQKRFQYDLQLKNSIPKINAKPYVLDKYYIDN